MAKLKDLTVGCLVEGLDGDEPVTIVAIHWFGNAGMRLDVFDNSLI